MGHYNPVVRTRMPHRQSIDLLLPTILARGERIIWRGQPRSPSASAESFGQFLFGVPLIVVGLTGGAVIGRFLLGAGPSAPSSIALCAFLVVPIIFVVLGLRMVMQPWRTRRRSATRIYALTDRRIIIVERGRHAEITSIALGNLGPIHLAVGDDGAGTIAIETHSESVDIDMVARVTRTVALENISDASEILKLIESSRQTWRANAQ